MYCQNCGSVLREDSTFCDSCGSQVRENGMWIERMVSETEVENPAGVKGESMNPVAKILAIVVIVIAVLFIISIISNLLGAGGSKKHRGSDTVTAAAEDDEESENDVEEIYGEDSDVTEDTEETADGEESSGVDLSSVDIDAVSDSYATFTGTLMDAGDSYVVSLQDSYTIYAYNDAGVDMVMSHVAQIVLNDTGGWDIDGYVGEEVTICGYLEIADQDMTMTLQSFDAPEPEEDTAIHTYQIMISDCTWSEALQSARDMGGYLVRINTREEYDYIISQLNAGDYTRYHFYLGGRRDSDGSDYYWVDTDNQFIGDCLNDSSSWCQSAWYDGEPSYDDAGVAEDAMNLFCVGGTWYLNDSSMDLAGNYPDLLTGKVGYIVEFE